ncbi:hypothetical protein STEG23_037881 [Scotinomys teguina]
MRDKERGREDEFGKQKCNITHSVFNPIHQCSQYHKAVILELLGSYTVASSLNIFESEMLLFSTVYFHQKTPPAHHLVSIFNCKQPQSLLKTQEQPVTMGRREPKSNQLPLEEEDPGAASHPQRKRTQEQQVILGGRGPRNSQSPQRKRIQEHPDTIGTRDLP